MRVTTMLRYTKPLTKHRSGDRLITIERKTRFVTDNSKPSESWRRKATSLSLPKKQGEYGRRVAEGNLNENSCV